MAIVQEQEGGGICHFTRRGLGLLLYLNRMMAQSLVSLQLLALTRISILASGPAKEVDIILLARRMRDWLSWLQDRILFVLSNYVIRSIKSVF